MITLFKNVISDTLLLFGEIPGGVLLEVQDRGSGQWIDYPLQQDEIRQVIKFLQTQLLEDK